MHRWEATPTPDKPRRSDSHHSLRHEPTVVADGKSKVTAATAMLEVEGARHRKLRAFLSQGISTIEGRAAPSVPSVPAAPADGVMPAGHENERGGVAQRRPASRSASGQGTEAGGDGTAGGEARGRLRRSRRPAPARRGERRGARSPGPGRCLRLARPRPARCHLARHRPRSHRPRARSAAPVRLGRGAYGARRAGRRLAADDARPGSRRGLCQSAPDAAVPPSRLAAALAGTAGDQGRAPGRDRRRPPGRGRRPGSGPPAPGHRERRHLHHHRGRERGRQSGGVAGGVRALSPGRARRPAPGGARQVQKRAW